MATVLYPGYSPRDSLYWEETDCLRFYGMLSLHDLFEVVGSQLTETDIEVLSFLLDETYPGGEHPLDPAGWTVKPSEGDPDGSTGVSPCPELLNAWRRVPPQGPRCPIAARHKPKTGLELLLELERSGHLSEGNLEPLLQLLRVLTRHDLLPLVSYKKRRAVSPERVRPVYNAGSRGQMCNSELTDTSAQTELPQGHSPLQFTRSLYPARPALSPRQKKRRKRGHGWSSRPATQRRTAVLPQPPPTPTPEKVACS